MQLRWLYPPVTVSLFPYLKNNLMGHGLGHRLLELITSTDTEIHTDNWIDRTL
uniref:Uncharacterized protein n=1 Tax=Amphimedon queenslandica TaxID=400682 RepID=A0A1X7VIV1_AMPQE